MASEIKIKLTRFNKIDNLKRIFTKLTCNLLVGFDFIGQLWPKLLNFNCKHNFKKFRIKQLVGFNFKI